MSLPTQSARSLSLIVFGIGLLAAIILAVRAGDEPSGSGVPAAVRQDIFPTRLDTLKPAGTRSFVPGTDKDAKEYYTNVSQELGLPGKDKPFESLDALLKYLGYNTLTARDLDVLAPEELAKKVQADWKDGDALVGRYFSPKTSDVSGRSNKLSWRKVVRLKPLPKVAEKTGLAAMHFLSVVYVDDFAMDPFPKEVSRTVNVQVILTRAKMEAAKDPAYWLVFDPAGGKYHLGYSTTTSWDAADPDLTKGLQPYYVPDSCLMCHGGDREVAILHSFDTDWYIDKVQPGEDFGKVLATPWGPLYDCGKDLKAPAKEAFDAFRKLNAEILAQNRDVLAKAEARAADRQRKGMKETEDEQAQREQVGRQAKSTAKWVELHRSSDQHVGPLTRGVGDARKGRVWNGADPLDKELLPLLNRYCYRCHGSIHYNAFDKQEVINKVNKMMEKMQEKELKDRMPQDRDMKCCHEADWKKLLDSLGRLKDKYRGGPPRP